MELMPHTSSAQSPRFFVQVVILCPLPIWVPPIISMRVWDKVSTRFSRSFRGTLCPLDLGSRKPLWYLCGRKQRGMLDISLNPELPRPGPKDLLDESRSPSSLKEPTLKPLHPLKDCGASRCLEDEPPPLFDHACRPYHAYSVKPHGAGCSSLSRNNGCRPCS